MPLIYRTFIACASKGTFTVRLAFKVITKMLTVSLEFVNVTFVTCNYRSFLVCEAHNLAAWGSKVGTQRIRIFFSISLMSDQHRSLHRCTCDRGWAARLTRIQHPRAWLLFEMAFFFRTRRGGAPSLLTTISIFINFPLNYFLNVRERQSIRGYEREREKRKEASIEEARPDTESASHRHPSLKPMSPSH